MKKPLALLLALVMCFSLAACGSGNDSANGKYALLIEMLEAERYEDAIAFIRALSGTTASPVADESPAGETTQPTVPEVSLSEEQLLILDAVQTILDSEDFANWQSLYKELVGNKPRKAEIDTIVHYSIWDFDGEEFEGYLVSIAADVAWWHNHDATQGGHTANHFNIFIDCKSKAVYDSITTDAGNGVVDTKTDERKAIYMLFVFGNILDGSYEGYYLNGGEDAVEMTAEEISMINAELILSSD